MTYVHDILVFKIKSLLSHHTFLFPLSFSHIYLFINKNFLVGDDEHAST